MSGYAVYEGLLSERLKSDAYDVSDLPLLSDLNSSAGLRRPVVYVVYVGSEYSDTGRLGDFSQYDTMTFEVIIRARSRSLIFSTVEFVLSRLLKWRVPGALDNITLSAFGYTSGGQNGWQYNLKFSFQGVLIISDAEGDISNVNGNGNDAVITKIDFKVYEKV